MERQSRMKIKLFFTSLVCAWAVAGAWAEPSFTDPAQITQEAYLALITADQSLEEGLLDTALRQYKQALNLYDKVAMDFPNWEPRIVQYRKAYCANQITDIERRSGGPVSSLASSPAPAPYSPSAQTPAPMAAARTETAELPIMDRSAEVDYLRRRIQQLETELIEQAEESDLHAELDELLAENRTLKESSEALRTSMDALLAAERSKTDALLLELADMEAEQEALQRNKELMTQLDQAMREVELERDELRGENTRLLDELDAMTQEMSDMEIAHDDEVEALQASIDELETRLQARAENAAAQAEQQSLQNENQALQKQVADLQKELSLARLQIKNTESAPPVVVAKTEPPAPQKTAVNRAPITTPSKSKDTTPSAPPPPTKPKAAKHAGALPAYASELDALEKIRDLLHQENGRDALALSDKALADFPQSGNLIHAKGTALLQLGQYNQAASLLLDLARTEPKNADVHDTLGAAMMGAGLYAEAREMLEKAVKLDKTLKEAQYNLAQLYALTEPKNLKAAKRAYQQALKLGLAPDAQLEGLLK